MSSEYEEELLDESLFAEEQYEIDSSSKTNPKYTKEDLQNSLREVSEGSSIYAASKKHNVPETTLRDRHRGVSSDKLGRKALFENETEKKLSDWIIECAVMGDPRTKEDE